MMNFRIGHGYDVHALAQGLPLWLGGIRIENALGCVIGLRREPLDQLYKGIDSKILLRRTVELIGRQGYAIGNVDCTLCLQRPKIKPHIPAMRETLASAMGIAPEAVSVKATTTERLGFVGREEGIEAHAVALIFKP